MMKNELGVIFFMGVAAYHMLLAGFILFSPRHWQGVVRWLLLFLLGSGAFALAQLLPSLWWQERLTVYGLLLLLLLFFYLSHAFLRLDERDGRLPWALLVGVLFLLGLDLLLPPPRHPWLFWQTISSWWWGAALLLWGLLLARTAVIIHHAYRQTTRRPLHRNRLRYWLLSAGLLGIGDLLFWLHAPALAHILRALAAALAAYATITYRLVDLRAIMRRTLSRFLAVIIIGCAYVILFLRVSESAPPMHPALLGACLAMVLALSLMPLQQGLQQVIAYLTAEIEYDPNYTLREYSLTISAIVDLNQLEATVVSLISEAMEIAHGTLFLVDTGADIVERPVYQLISVHGFGVEKLELGAFDANSPVADFLAQERRPLTQYDIDLLPQFQEISVIEKEWLLGLGVDVYVPIHAQGNWIGLLGLGPKMSGSRYYEQDLLLLSTLADQTAVALENARLVANLVRLNHDRQRAYDDLEQANQQLQQTDRLKSDFIGMITHELRTPFANIGFSLRLFQQHGLHNLTPAQQEELVKLQQGITTAQDMVDNLVKFAAFLQKQRLLRYTEFDCKALILEVIRPLQPLADNKGISLHVNGVTAMITITGDRAHLTDAMHHLVHNAIKFTAPGGSIQIRAWQQQGSLYFEVQDTGVGVPAAKLPTLWDTFAQTADPVRRGVEGIGLGLALVKYIATAHHGDVYASSEEQVGSVFGFTIPVRPVTE